jgi:hypothetical protein
MWSSEYAQVGTVGQEPPAGLWRDGLRSETTPCS